MKGIVMTEEEENKAHEIVGESLAKVTIELDKLLKEQDDKHKLFVLEGAIHAIIHLIEDRFSGLHATQFVIGAVNEFLLAHIHQHINELEEEDDDDPNIQNESEMVH